MLAVSRIAVELAGVTGDGRPLADPMLGSILDAFRTLSGSAGGSLLGAGVKLLLGPLLTEPLTVGKLLKSGAGVLDGFFWKNPVIDFWFLLDCELDCFLRAGGLWAGVVVIGPAMTCDA